MASCIVQAPLYALRFRVAPMAGLKNLSLLNDWSLVSRGECSNIHLGLISVLCIGGDLIYIYGNHPLAPDATPALSLPQSLAELLIFEPVVPLRYTPHGFQALLPSEWDAMSVQKDSYIGLSTWSSAHESLATSNNSSQDEEEQENSSISSDEMKNVTQVSSCDEGDDDGSSFSCESNRDD